jgi:transposase
LTQPDSDEVAWIIQELGEPLAAIVTNAQAGLRSGGASGLDPELVEVLSDMAEDGKRAGELLRRLEALLTGNEP